MSNWTCRSCSSGQVSLLARFEGFPSAAQAFYNCELEAKDDPATAIQLFKCNSCQLIQISNTPVAYFKNVITAASLGEESKARLRAEWEPLFERYSSGCMKVLEVGAGKGDFVRLLKAWGHDAVGLEYEVTSHDGIMIPGYFPGTQLNQSYDLIVCNNFLEHHPRPMDFLLAINDHLSPGGYLYVSVPRWEYLYQKACFYELIPDHLSYFTSISLFRLLDRSGFEVREYYTKNNDNDHVVFCRKNSIENIEGQLETFEEIVTSLRTFLEDQHRKGQSVAVWGAGHRALSLLSMIGPGYINLVVDSAPFKQGLYTPVTGIRIVSPSEFARAPTNVLLLMLPGESANHVLFAVKGLNISSEVYKFDDSREIKKIL